MFPNDDYDSVNLPFNMGDRELFPDGKMRLFKHKHELKSCGTVIYEEKFHGPPHHVHGGAQAYILDELMGCTGWMHNIPVVAKKIDIEFLKPTPLNTELRLFGEIVTRDETTLHIKARMCDADNTVYSQSSGDFRILTEEKIKELTFER